METDIGATLREARNRRKIDLSEVEAATKIRHRFLQAIENEEWDVLPGAVYTRGFIRTYASYLGLDGERLAEEYRRSTMRSEPKDQAPRVEPVASGAPGPRARPPSWVWVAAVSVALVGIMVGIGLAGDGDDASPVSTRARTEAAPRDETNAKVSTPSRPGVAVRLAATAEVWVCLLDARGEELIDGQILSAGAQEGPFRSGSFTVSFGNGEVTMRVDGRDAAIPVTSSPIGYEIDGEGELTELEEGERPDCA